MEKVRAFSLSKLPYDYNALEPFISEQQLKLHHDKHHQAYINGANAAFDKIDKARSQNMELEIKPLLKELSFNIGGHILHSIFWENLAPAGKGGGGQPSGAIADMINMGFGSFEHFKKQFIMAASSIEGSGWAALAVHPCIGRPLIMQIEKHNTNVYPTFNIIMVLDVWEHAYYLDYKNERPKFIEAFWNIVNWGNVNKNLTMVK